MKKITDLGFSEGILCTTEEEATKICKLMNEAGLVRRSNKIISEEDTHRDDTRGNGITYFPKDGTYGTDNYEGKTSKYKIYPAVLFYLREEVVEKVVPQRMRDVIEEYNKNYTQLNDKKLIDALEKHAPKTKKFAGKDIRNYMASLPINEQTFLNGQFLKDFLKEHNLLTDDE